MANCRKNTFYVNLWLHMYINAYFDIRLRHKFETNAEI